MRTKTFNPTSTPTRVWRAPAIGVTLKTGVFTLNRAAINKLDLKHGDMVQFHQDEDNPEDWYIEKVKANGFVLREAGKSCNLVFNSKPLALSIFESVAYEKSGGRMPIGEEFIHGKSHLWAVVTAKLLND